MQFLAREENSGVKRFSIDPITASGSPTFTIALSRLPVRRAEPELSDKIRPISRADPESQSNVQLPAGAPRQTRRRPGLVASSARYLLRTAVDRFRAARIGRKFDKAAQITLLEHVHPSPVPVTASTSSFPFLPLASCDSPASSDLIPT